VRISQTKAVNLRGTVKWKDFLSQVESDFGSPLVDVRDLRLARLWYKIVQPKFLKWSSESARIRSQLTLTRDQTREADALLNRNALSKINRALIGAIKAIHDPENSVSRNLSDVELIRWMAERMLGVIGGQRPSRHQLDLFFDENESSPQVRWPGWAANPDLFLKDLMEGAVKQGQRVDPELGTQMAKRIKDDPGFQALEEVDADFGAKVLWLKERSWDVKRFKFAWNELIQEVNTGYQTLLVKSSAELRAAEPSLHPMLKNSLLKQAYQATLQSMIADLGLSVVNLDEVYGIRGRADPKEFAKDLFPGGYIFWDRGLSSLQSLDTSHGRDFHILQAVIFGKQMDHEMGEGAFLNFYKKIGRELPPGRQMPYSPASREGRGREMPFYNFGWIHLFDDVYFQSDRSWGKGTFTLTGDLNRVLSALLPFIYD